MNIPKPNKAAQRQPAEVTFFEELERLAAMDLGPVPPGWRMSPIAVEKFVLGDERLKIERKFVADHAMVKRIIISLCTNRGCLLVGEPGTAKSWLAELLTAAISGRSTLTLQGGGLTKVQQLLYSWNEAILSSKGPCLEALIPSPLLRGMMDGQLVRFEEIARCPQILQDALLSILSDRMIVIPEIANDDGIIFAREGFNLLATSNSVDAGIHEMSAALKRRMDFEEIRPIKNLVDEIAVLMRDVKKANARSGINMDIDESIIEVLATIFHELRNGQTTDGRSTSRLASAALSTAEAVSVAHAACLNAWYYGDGKLTMEYLVHHIIGSALKDNPEDRKRFKRYFETVVALRKGERWAQLYELRSLIH